MIFVYPLTVTKNTPQTAPIRFSLPILQGRITKMNLQYPSGVVALTHVRLQRGLHQLFPTNAEQTFATSNETIWWEEEELVDQPPYEVIALAWNDDVANDHTITVRIVMQPLADTSRVLDEIRQLLTPHP